jgi:hypothetical protein
MISIPPAEENSTLLLSRVYRWLLVMEARLRERFSSFSEGRQEVCITYSSLSLGERVTKYTIVTISTFRLL